MRNIELKARLTDLEVARQTAAALATERLGVQHQLDTYFFCRDGRLKLREIDDHRAELIAYTRPDQQSPKGSDYLRVPVSDAPLLKAVLTAALGLRCIVEKRREIFLVHQVRIHLDEVPGLGCFLEFEAVLGPEVDEAQGHAQLAELMAHFGLSTADLLPGSYGEMRQA